MCDLGGAWVVLGYDVAEIFIDATVEIAGIVDDDAVGV